MQLNLVQAQSIYQPKIDNLISFILYLTTGNGRLAIMFINYRLLHYGNTVTRSSGYKIHKRHDHLHKRT